MYKLAPACLVLLIIVGAGCGPSVKSPMSSTPKAPVEIAQLPYYILNAHDGRTIKTEEFWKKLGLAQAVCVGESHTDLHHHWSQLEVIKHLMADTDVFAIGMEMFQRPFQGVLDDFSTGKISERQLLTRTDWRNRWSFDWEMYAPLVRYTIANGGSLLALNISVELKEKWKKSGRAEFSASEAKNFPELDLEDKQHKEWFRSLMERIGDGHSGEGQENGHPGADSEFIDKIYPVQVLWDETMADTASRWVQAEKNRQIAILAGNGHCHDSAIVSRMKRRGVKRVLSIRPVVDTGAGEVASILASPENDFLFVMEAPQGSKENEK